MSTIAVSELHNTGFQLFEDSESFLNELNDTDSTSINGGKMVVLVALIAILRH